MIEPKIIYNGDFTKLNLHIEFVNEQHMFRPEFEAKLPELWQTFVEEAKKKGITPWDSSSYSLVNIDDCIKTKTLKLSTVSYSRIRARGQLEKENELMVSEYTNHIATGAVIETTDEFFVLGQRGKTIHATDVDFIGGGLQNDEIEVNDITDFERNAKKEMFEEINVSEDLIDKISGIGILFSSTSNVLFFYKVKLNIDSKKLKEIFKDRPEDEMSDLILLKKAEFLNYIKTLTSYRPLVAELLS